MSDAYDIENVVVLYGQNRVWLDWLSEKTRLAQSLLDGDSVCKTPDSVLFNLVDTEEMLDEWFRVTIGLMFKQGDLFEIRFRDRQGSPCQFHTDFSSKVGKDLAVVYGTRDLAKLREVIDSRPKHVSLIVIDATSASERYRYLCHLSSKRAPH